MIKSEIFSNISYIIYVFAILRGFDRTIEFLSSREILLKSLCLTGAAQLGLVDFKTSIL